MKRFLVLSLLIGLVAGFTGCNSKTDPYFEGDARVISKIFTDDDGISRIKYGLEFVVYGNKSLSSVTVNTAYGFSQKLTVSSSLASWTTKDEDFVDDPYEFITTYTFTVMLSETDEYVNKINSKITKVISPVNFTKCEYNVAENGTKQILLQWGEIEDAYYILTVKDEKGTTVYTLSADSYGTPFSYKTLTDSFKDGILTIYSNSLSSAATGDIFTVQVQAYAYCSPSGGSYVPYYECISIAEQTVVWGQLPD